MTPKLDYASDYTLDRPVGAGDTALVIIDMQRASASRSEGQGRLLIEEGRPEIGQERFDRIEQVVVPNLSWLLAEFRSNDRPIIHVMTGAARADYMDVAPHLREIARARGNLRGTRVSEAIDGLEPVGSEVVLWKTTVSCFTSTGIESLLHAMGIRSLLLTGVSTNQCVGFSAFDAADRGFAALLVEDCCGATKAEYHDATLVNHQRFLGRVTSSREVMEELQSS